MRSCLFFAACVMVLAFSSPGWACLCDTLATPERAFSESAAVFTGKYLGEEYRGGIKDEAVEMHFDFFGKRQEYQMLVQRFRVTRWFKGGSSTETILITSNARMADGTEMISDCGLGFKVGWSYLIYAYGNEKEYGSGECTRTRRLSRAKSDLAVLERLSGGPTKR